MAEFYKNLKVLSQDLYKKSATAQTNFRAAKTAETNVPGNNLATPGTKKVRSSFMGSESADLTQSIAAVAAAFNSGGNDALHSSLTSAHHPATALNNSISSASAFQTHPPDYFTADALLERMKMYAQQGGVNTDYLTNNNNNHNNVNT